jgi:hypothetical protein
MPVIDSISDYNWNVLFDEEVNWKYFLLDVNVADDYNIYESSWTFPEI